MQRHVLQLHDVSPVVADGESARVLGALAGPAGLVCVPVGRRPSDGRAVLPRVPGADAAVLQAPEPVNVHRAAVLDGGKLEGGDLRACLCALAVIEAHGVRAADDGCVQDPREIANLRNVRIRVLLEVEEVPVEVGRGCRAARRVQLAGDGDRDVDQLRFVHRVSGRDGEQERRVEGQHGDLKAVAQLPLEFARGHERVEHPHARAELDEKGVPGTQRLVRDEDDRTGQILQLVRYPPVEEGLLGVPPAQGEVRSEALLEVEAGRVVRVELRDARVVHRLNLGAFDHFDDEACERR
mmetsp:Transcript_7986/g.19420  ORF Transcript_7986/g.19420 Transcript_7986/m.19420 type:complete len:296 (+) Transcript_7986:2102-2989(+)